MTLLCAEDNLALDVLPVGMQNSALVLKDEDGNSVTDLAEFSNSSESILTPAAINIENSSDVIIGPVTQFNGPVTIYQNVNGSAPRLEDKKTADTNCENGKLVKSDSTSSEGPHTADKSLKNLPFSKRLIYIGIPLIIFVIALVATITILALNKTNEVLNKKSDHHQNDYVDDGTNHLKPFGPGAIVDKRLWGGRPALNFTRPLRHPTPLVIIIHTVTPWCGNFTVCSKRVQSIQSYHVAKKESPDIGYNFLVGGDGNAYVGRGWDIQNFSRNDSISISFIGNFVFDYLTPEMIGVTKKLLQEGVHKGKLARNYKLVAHNQTYNTESPGSHVYEVIKTWPHYDPLLYYQ